MKNRLFAEGGLSRGLDSDLADRIQAPDVGAAVRFFPVVGPEFVREHRDLAAHRPGVAAGQKNQVFLLPFDAVVGENFNRQIGIAAAEIQALGKTSAARNRQRQKQGDTRPGHFPGRILNPIHRRFPLHLIGFRIPG